MGLVKLACVTASLTLWKVLAVAGVFLLVIVPPLPPPPSALKEIKKCDAKFSSIARRIIHQTLMPVVTTFSPDIKLPYQCPLHPVRDVHGKAELAKLNYRVNLWTCSKCGKSFTGEQDLEDHIDRRHPDLSEPEDFSVCLADYCDVLRCAPQKDRVIRKPWPVRQTDNIMSSSQQLARAPSRELVALLENTETGLILGPGPGHFCGTGHCAADTEHTLEVAASRLRRHLITDNSSDTHCRDCYSHRKSCHHVNMEKLRHKCEMLVDMCVSPLALNLTDKELVELRDKIDKEICSFLTCDKYWTADRTKYNVNIGAILLITLTLAILYLFFVYHLIWVWY